MEIDQVEISLLIKTLKNCGGYDFSNYSEKSFCRRVEKVLMDNKVDIYTLVNRLKFDRVFLEKVVRDITVNTTELFRDPQTWQAIRYRILPRLANKNEILIWHAGCSIGMEVYSMEILLNELGLLEKAKIYATDLNTEVLETARKGEYSYRYKDEYIDNFTKALVENPFNFEEKNEVNVDKYFDSNPAKDVFKVKPFLLNKTIFLKHDLVTQGNPFGVGYDLILCRNVLIYFNHDLQNKIFCDFWNYLNHNGSLVLGIHESILGTMALRYEKKGFFYIKKPFDTINPK